ncbi:MAG: thioredoxin domain-containing protein [Acidimicrobiales bacterium]
MDRVLLVLGGIVIAGAVAALLGRRTAPPAANTHHIPRQLDRRDFPRAEAPWLVAVFTSATCATCAGVWDRARHLESDQVAVVELELGAAAALHERYKIDAVPTLVITDATGEVRRAFLGPTTATDLWAAVAEVRDPGSVPPDCHTGEL